MLLSLFIPCSIICFRLSVHITSSPFRELPKLEFDEYREDELGVGTVGDLLGPCWLDPTDSWNKLYDVLDTFLFF